MERYIYKGIVAYIYDGDTIRIDIDLGFNTWIKYQSLRLKGIDAPELRGEEKEAGILSRDWIRQKLPVGTEVIIKTEKDSKEKYGRYIATVYLDDVDINQLMIDEGFAIEYVA